MKQVAYLISLLAICSLVILPDNVRAERESRWGYILHTAPLSQTGLSRALDSYSVIALTGFRLDHRGHLKYRINDFMQSVLTGAREKHTVVYPLISFTSPENGHAFLNDHSSRSRGISAIGKMLHTLSLTGIHLDFEYLPAGDARVLADFLKSLKSSLPGIRITMALFPPLDFPRRWSSFHDLSLIGDRLDEAVLMCYDYHRPGGPPGPVTDLIWSERNIIHTLRYIPADRLWLGVPAYGYSWSGKGTTSVLSARQGKALAATFGFARDPSGTIQIRYRKDNLDHTAWVADGETEKQMAELAAKYNLRGTALWRLGLEEKY